MHRRRRLAAPLLAAPLASQAQALFGDRPIRMIVSVAVAGTSDIVGRIMADAMTPLLSRQMISVRPGTLDPALAAPRAAVAGAMADPAVPPAPGGLGLRNSARFFPAAAEALLRSEIARWTPIVARLNLKPS